MNVLDYLRRFDSYPKTLEEFRVRTASGAFSKLIFFKLQNKLFIYIVKRVHNKTNLKC